MTGQTQKVGISMSILADQSVLATALNAIFGILAFVSGIFDLNVYFIWFCWTISYLSGSWLALIESWEALTNKTINIDILMLLAAYGALMIGSVVEGAVLLFLFSLSHTLQNYTLQKSRQAISSLMKLRPDTALIKSGDQWLETAVSDVAINDICLVRPGDNIAVDGNVIFGTSSVDQSPITGESVPVDKIVDDQVFAGTKNGNGALEIKVTALSHESTLAKIIEIVERAETNKAKTQVWLESAEKYYAMFVIAVAIGIAFLPDLFSPDSSTDYVYQAITWLVIASPCALVISTPASILCALANAARNGILFKGGKFLEQSSGINMIAIDKTGTLTTGMLKLDSIFSPYLSEERLLAVVAALEDKSEHSLAQTIVDYAKEKKIDYSLSVADWKMIPGQGVSGDVAGGSYLAGNKKMIEMHNILIDNEFEQQLIKLHKSAATIVYVVSCEENRLIGLLGFSDSIRASSFKLVEDLKKIGINKLMMLTGDNKASAEYVATQLNITEYASELLPADKVARIDELNKNYNVAMVGDGINDAPSLATASLGISMGRGATDVAIDTADVVLMSNELLRISYLIKLAKRVQVIIRQNLVFSASVIFLLVLTNFLELLPLTIGVIAHEGSTLLVVFNSLRLLFFSDNV